MRNLFTIVLLATLAYFVAGAPSHDVQQKHSDSHTQDHPDHKGGRTLSERLKYAAACMVKDKTGAVVKERKCQIKCATRGRQMVYEGKDLTAYYCESPHSKADLKETIEQLKALIDRHGEEKIEKGVYIGNRPYDSYGYGTGSYGNRPYDSYGYGTGSYGNRPHNSYGYGTSSYGNWPYDNYGHGTGSYGNRPYDSYGHGTGSYGNRPYYREGYRRRYNGYRPYGNRPYGGGNRPYGNRPYGGGNRPYGNGGYGGGSSSSEGGFSSRKQD